LEIFPFPSFHSQLRLAMQKTHLFLPHFPTFSVIDTSYYAT
jgi:hypothetical protein